MLFGAAGMSGSMVILAAMTAIGGSGPGIVAATFLFIFNTFFAIGKAPPYLRHAKHTLTCPQAG